MQYDFLIIGAGLSGCTFAREATDAGATCLIVDKRDHIGGNCATKIVDGIQVHRYGAHLFHTSNEATYNFVSRFTTPRPYAHRLLANAKGRLYNLPFTLITFGQIYGVTTREQAEAAIAADNAPYSGTPFMSLEDFAIRNLGRKTYETIVRGYTEKQWGMPCGELPSSILQRLVISYDMCPFYFRDRYQFLPNDGYTEMCTRMIDGIDLRLRCDFLSNRSELAGVAKRIVYSGAIDQLFDHCYGKLSYRSLRFEHELFEQTWFQPHAVINYCDADVPWTRIVEHKRFTNAASPVTVITKEYSQSYDGVNDPFYPIADKANRKLSEKYLSHAMANGIIPIGRLGTFRYLDMDKAIEAARKEAASAIAEMKQEAIHHEHSAQ